MPIRSRATKCQLLTKIADFFLRSRFAVSLVGFGQLCTPGLLPQRDTKMADKLAANQQKQPSSTTAAIAQTKLDGDDLIFTYSESGLTAFLLRKIRP